MPAAVLTIYCSGKHYDVIKDYKVTLLSKRNQDRRKEHTWEYLNQ